MFIAVIDRAAAVEMSSHQEERSLMRMKSVKQTAMEGVLQILSFTGSPLCNVYFNTPALAP